MNDTTEQANFEPKVLKSSSDSVFKDSTIVEAKTIKIADNELDDNVKYMAQDSIVYDIPNKTVYLYGRATIKYQEMELAASFAPFIKSKTSANITVIIMIGSIPLIRSRGFNNY